MTSAGFQCRIYAVDVHRFLLHQQGSNRFEYYTEVNILSVTDSSLNTSGVVGMRFNPSVVVEEYVVLLGAFHLQSLESFSIFEGFGGIDTEHGVAQGGVQFAEHRLPQSDRTSFDDTGQRTSDGIAFAFYLIYKVKGEGDTIGGTLTCVIKGCPIGLGQPVFGKLHAALGNAMLSINAAKAFEYGEGFKGLKMKGSEQNDVFFNNNGRIETHTNHSGGIQGGISNGQDIYFRVVFKPIATLLMEQETVNIDGVDTTLKARGRHDACVLPRAVPIVEAMAAMTILDYYLLDKTTQL